jgi:hypothetical protein
MKPVEHDAEDVLTGVRAVAEGAQDDGAGPRAAGPARPANVPERQDPVRQLAHSVRGVARRAADWQQAGSRPKPLYSKPYRSSLHAGASIQVRNAMDRRKFLLGLFAGLTVAPAIVAAASRGEAAPLPDAGLPATPTGADPDTVQSDWTQAVGARRLRRIERRAARRDRRTLRRVARRDRRVMRRERRVIRRMRRRGAIY